MLICGQTTAFLSRLFRLNRRPSHRAAYFLCMVAAYEHLHRRPVPAASCPHNLTQCSSPRPGCRRRMPWLLLPIVVLTLGACQLKPAGSMLTSAATTTRMPTAIPVQTTTCMPVFTPTPRMSELPFETIVNDSHSFYEGLDTRLILVYGPTNVPHLADLPQQVQQALNAVDYRTELVIALYGGSTGACPAGTGITRIAYDGMATVHVEAIVRTLKITDAVCSPYHIVQLKKPEAMMDRRVRFVLVDHGEELIKQEY